MGQIRNPMLYPFELRAHNREHAAEEGRDIHPLPHTQFLERQERFRVIGSRCPQYRIASEPLPDSRCRLDEVSLPSIQRPSSAQPLDQRTLSSMWRGGLAGQALAVGTG